MASGRQVAGRSARKYIESVESSIRQVHANVYFEALEVAFQSSVHPWQRKNFSKHPTLPTPSVALHGNSGGLLGRHFVGREQRAATGASSSSGVFESLFWTGRRVARCVGRTPPKITSCSVSILTDRSKIIAARTPLSMINPEDDIVVDPKTSCSREEVVAKLLGWLQGSRRRPFTTVTEHGISVDQLANMHTLDGSTVLALLQGHRREAQEAFVASANSDDLVETIQIKEQAVIECDRLIDKAQSYFVDFDDEVAKGDASVLLDDPVATERHGTKHYTLKSVEAWSMATHGISVLDPAKSKPVPQQLADCDLKERGPKDGLSKTEADNLYITLGLLIASYAKVKGSGRLNKTGGGINKSQILADLLPQIAAASNGKSFPGQGARTLGGHITEALRVVDEATRMA